RAEDNSAAYVNPAHRMSVRQVLAEWKPAGYRLLDLREDLPSQHVFILAANESSGQTPTIADSSLSAAIPSGAVAAKPHGRDERSVVVSLRRTGKDRLVVTTGVGEYFASPQGQTRDMVATRDGSVALFDDEWHELTILAAGVSLDKSAPRATNNLELRPERAR